ncbi:MAG: hypothetical protein ABIQ26_03000 [Streptosporangiaceae bacterium]
MPPSPDVTRPAAAMVAVIASLTQAVSLPSNFEVEAYLGVTAILMTGLTAMSAFLLLVSGGRGTWLFTLVTGGLNVLGYIVSRTVGYPFADSLYHDWFHPLGFTIAFTGVVTVLLSLWNLIPRHR